MSQSISLDEVAKLRPGLPEDLKFVYSTWLRDLRHADSSALPDDIWFPAHREYINRVLSDPKVMVVIACPVDAPKDILGYVVAEAGEILHWIQIKPKFRGKGLCRRLLEASQSLASPATWSTSDARMKLKNRRRSRQLQSRYQLAES